ncbi:hypothetical protein FQN49_000771 [Arthroderma sp. PD_2]|nr:hypothetical protein FQN49_000771 [Arthroderma sp. PD_2]
MSLESNPGSNDSDCMIISDTDSLEVIASETPTRENSLGSDNKQTSKTANPLQRHPTFEIAPEELKDMIEELINPYYSSSTPVHTSAPPASDSAMAPALAPEPAPAVATAVTDASTVTVEAAGLPALNMSCPSLMEAVPSIEALDANAVKSSETDASLAADIVDAAPTPLVATTSSGSSTNASAAVASSSATSMASSTLAHPGAIALEYIRKNAFPPPLKPEPPIMQAPAKPPGFLQTPTHATSKAQQMVFGKPTMPYGSAASLSTNNSAANPFGNAKFSPPSVSSGGAYSCPLATTTARWLPRCGSEGPGTSSSPDSDPMTRGQTGFSAFGSTPPNPFPTVPRGERSFSTFANAIPCQTGENNHGSPGLLGRVNYIQRSARVSTAVPPRSPGPNKLLEDVDIASLEPKSAIFYFGVICVQERLASCFEYLEYFDNMWMVRLRFAGHEISKMQSYHTKAAATADACRGGLAVLKDAMPLWALPHTPQRGIQPDQVRWNILLGLYSEQRGLENPIYTQYSNFDGYRYEVEVAGLSFFGVEKCYPTIDEAIIGCSHEALHFLIVSSGEKGEMMHKCNPSPIFLAEPEIPAPRAPSPPSPNQDQSKFPFVPSGSTPINSKSRRRSRQQRRQSALWRQSEARNYPKPQQQLTAASNAENVPPTVTGANSFEPSIDASTEVTKALGRATTPAFFSPSLGNKESLGSFDVPDAAEFSRAIFFECRKKNNGTKVSRDQCTASEFRSKLASCKEARLRVNSICDRLSISCPSYRSKVVERKNLPTTYEVDAHFYHDIGLRKFKGIGFASSENKLHAELLCQRNTAAFLMEVMMGVNRLRGGDWIEDATMQDKTGFYL